MSAVQAPERPAHPSNEGHRGQRTLLFLALFAFGLGLALHHGRQGYMPLDQSIAFDGGWRILSGQVPFRDYHAPNGFTVHVLQALFFGVFGVTWFAYCLHAAVLNGVFAVLVARVLERLGLNLPAALVYGALSAVVLVPPMGVPYMDQHAFFFAFVAVALALRARAAPEAGWTWFAIPAVMVVAALAKQIPSAFAIPIVLACVPWTRLGHARRAFWLMVWGSLATTLLITVAIPLLGIDLARIQTYFVRLPYDEGQYRTSFAPTLSAMIERMRYDGGRVGLWSVQVVHLALAIGVVAGVLVLARGPRGAEQTAWLGRLVGRPLLGWGLLLVCLGFALLTSNQLELGFPYVFAALGLVHATLEVCARHLGPRAKRTLLGAGVVLLAIGLRDAWFFERTVNATRSVNDMQFSEELADAAGELPPGLEFMRWQLPPLLQYDAEQFSEVYERIAAAEGGVFLISDASILYGLARKPSAAPSLWFHPGLLIPREDDPAFAAYEDELLERLEALDVRLVVLEDAHARHAGSQTWTGYGLHSFPRLAALVEARRAETTVIGPFQLIELRSQ